jgi:hypothetical protein
MGLHVAVKALKLPQKRLLNARLRISGAHQPVGMGQNGYVRWVNWMIQQLALASAVVWLGPLTASLEGLNILFFATKYKARGYRSSEHQMAMPYFIADKLQIPSY